MPDCQATSLPLCRRWIKPRNDALALNTVLYLSEVYDRNQYTEPIARCRKNPLPRQKGMAERTTIDRLWSV